MPGPSNILLVEDHADSAVAVTRLLMRLGHEVHVAETYAAAMEAAQSTRFDLLLCDIGLPDGDGCDLLAEVRSMYPISAIALTGYGMSGDVARCQDAGFAEHLLKPVDARLLAGSIDRVIALPPPPMLAGNSCLDDVRPLP
jgi:CheY-like chemotaxis protein